jgi:hypothetical protein
MASIPQVEKYIVTSRNPKKNNTVRSVWMKKKGDGTKKFKISKSSPGDGWTRRFKNKDNAKKAEKYAEKQGQVPRRSRDKYPFLVLNGGVYGKADLSKKMNQLGESQLKYMRMGSYKRTQQQQHDLYLLYIRGQGNLAAYCNTRYRGEHSWSQCSKYPPCASNHCSGGACDLSYYHSGRSGGYTNVGSNDKFRSEMKRLYLCLPVGGEKWHVEIGNTWRS